MANQDDINTVRDVLRVQFLAVAARFCDNNGHENYNQMQDAVAAMGAFNADQHWATDICMSIPIKGMLRLLADTVRGNAGAKPRDIGKHLSSVADENAKRGQLPHISQLTGK